MGRQEERKSQQQGHVKENEGNEEKKSLKESNVLIESNNKGIKYTIISFHSTFSGDLGLLKISGIKERRSKISSTT